MHFENEIEHKILVTYVIAKVSYHVFVADQFPVQPFFGMIPAADDIRVVPLQPNRRFVPHPCRLQTACLFLQSIRNPVQSAFYFVYGTLQWSDCPILQTLRYLRLRLNN